MPDNGTFILRAPTVNERGILFIVAATASFTTCDTLIKLATVGLPVIESMFFRSLFAVLWALPLVAMTGGLKRIRQIADKRVLLRGFFELTSAVTFLVGLANMPIAEITSLIQLAPIFLLLIAAVFLGLKVTRVQFGLAVLSFIGAVLVVQPGSSGFTLFAAFGVIAAILAAARDLTGRSVPAGISGVIVALGAMVVSLIGTGIGTLAFETFVVPSTHQLILIAASSFFLVGAQVFVFRAYRHAEPGAVAPFFYSGALWATISSGLVFGTLPNGLAFTGIGLIVASGVGVLLIADRRGQQPELPI